MNIAPWLTRKLSIPCPLVADTMKTSWKCGHAFSVRTVSPITRHRFSRAATSALDALRSSICSRSTIIIPSMAFKFDAGSLGSGTGCDSGGCFSKYASMSVSLGLKERSCGHGSEEHFSCCVFNSTLGHL